MYPRKFLDKKKHEIDRLVRSNKYNNNIFYVKIRIPEKNSGFDGDLYPKNESGRPLYTQKKWKEIIEGKIKEEIINIDNENNDTKVKVKDEEKKEQKSLNDDNKAIGKEVPIESDMIKINERKENDDINKELQENKSIGLTEQPKIETNENNNI